MGKSIGLKIRELAKKWMVLVMAAVLLLGGTVAMTAEAQTDCIPVKVESKGKIQKVWTVADPSMFDEKTGFTLELSYLGKSNLGTNEAADPAGIQTGKPVNVIIGGTGKWTAHQTDSRIHTADRTWEEVFGGITFSTPGVYHFSINEKAGTDPNVVYSGQSYYVEIQVSWEVDSAGVQTGALHMDGLAVYGSPQKGMSDKVDIALFENREAKNSSLTVSKTVKGNAANKKDVFEYTIQITGVSGTYPASNAAGKVTAVNGTITEKISLKHGESFVIRHLPVGAVYTVTETDTGYSESYRINNGETKEGLTVTGTIGKENTGIWFYNTRTITPPTGVFLDVIPYVLLLAAAAVGCIVFFVFRRRRSF